MLKLGGGSPPTSASPRRSSPYSRLGVRASSEGPLAEPPPGVAQRPCPVPWAMAICAPPGAPPSKPHRCPPLLRPCPLLKRKLRRVRGFTFLPPHQLACRGECCSPESWGIAFGIRGPSPLSDGGVHRASQISVLLQLSRESVRMRILHRRLWAGPATLRVPQAPSGCGAAWSGHTLSGEIPPQSLKPVKSVNRHKVKGRRCYIANLPFGSWYAVITS